MKFHNQAVCVLLFFVVINLACQVDLETVHEGDRFTIQLQQSQKGGCEILQAEQAYRARQWSPADLVLVEVINEYKNTVTIKVITEPGGPHPRACSEGEVLTISREEARAAKHMTPKRPRPIIRTGL